MGLRQGHEHITTMTSTSNEHLDDRFEFTALFASSIGVVLSLWKSFKFRWGKIAYKKKLEIAESHPSAT